MLKIRSKFFTAVLSIFLFSGCTVGVGTSVGFASQAEPLKADKILVEKSKRKLHLLKDGKVVKSYKVALGGNPKGHKTQQGDQKTPEGIYKISGRFHSANFRKSMKISYPNAADRKQAKQRGVSAGGDIMLHGLGKSRGWIGKAHTATDWTLGCIAVTNDEIDEIWGAVPDGVEIEIKP